jgi:hypothetical protein
MTYAKSSSITAADYNTFAGLTGTAAASAVAAQNKAGHLYGVGYGDRGYGQLTPALTGAIVGQAVGQEWQTLRTVMSNLATWQNTVVTLLPPSASLTSGASITAHERDAPSLNAYDFQDQLALLDTSRLNYIVGNMTLTSNVATTIRGTTWGAGATGITCEFSVTFASEDAARYFFNTGGEVRLSFQHADISTPRNASWNTVLNNLIIAFRANSSARLTGSYGTPAAIGYYQLTTAYQTIINGTDTGISPYTINDFVVNAKASTITGLNGAKGSVIMFQVILTDQQTNAFSDIVAAGTNVVLSHLRAVTTMGIAAPSAAVTAAF